MPELIRISLVEDNPADVDQAKAGEGVVSLKNTTNHTRR